MTPHPIRIHPELGQSKRGDRIARRSRCVERYVARVGYLPSCGWEGHLVRVIGSDEIPPCPRCGSWTEPVNAVASLRVMNRFRDDGWPR